MESDIGSGTETENVQRAWQSCVSIYSFTFVNKNKRKSEIKKKWLNAAAKLIRFLMLGLEYLNYKKA